MKRLFFNSSIFFVSFLFYTSALFSQETKYLRLDIDNANGVSFSTLFKSVNFIQLESTQSSLFGRIDQLEVTDEFYFILDFDTNSILCFDNKGKYLYRIEGGKQFIKRMDRAIISFSVDRLNRQIFVNWKGGARAIFGFDGKIKDKERLIDYQSEYLFKDGSSVIYRFDRSSGNYSDDIVWVNKNMRVRNRVLPTFIKKNYFSKSDFLPSMGKVFFEKSDSTVFFSRPYDYSVYHISMDILQVPYKLILPVNYSLPKQFVEDSSFYNKRALYLIRENPKKIYSISSFFELKEKLFFSLASVTNKHEFSLVYDNKKGELYSLKELETDSTNFFLTTNYLVNEGVHAFYDEKMFSSISASDFKNSYLRTTQKRNKNEELYLSQFIKNMTDNSNPILIQLSTK